MSNIAGKAYAMNLVTPLRGALGLANKLIFRVLDTRAFRKRLDELLTLSMIHCARWVILRPQDFPRLSDEQPRETLRHAYMLFLSSFNGSWEQYVDSFSAAAPSGPDLLWYVNAGWPRPVSGPPFHRHVEHDQLWTDYFYSAYPLAEAGDLKAARRVKRALGALIASAADATPERFQEEYEHLLASLSGDLVELGEGAGLAGGSLAPPRRDRSFAPSLPEDEAEVSGVTALGGEEAIERGRRRRAQ